jgi:hypothetical protein
MGHIAWEEDERAVGRLQRLIPAAEGDRPVQHIECLVLGVMGVRRRRKAGGQLLLDETEAAMGLLGTSLADHQSAEELEGPPIARGEDVASGSSASQP